MKAYKLIASVAAAAAGLSGLAYAGDEMTSLSYISYLERYATVQAAESKESVDAVVNMPVITGDRVDTARGARVEVQLADGSTIWFDEFSTLDFDALAASRENPAQRTVLYLQEGTVAIEIPATAQGDGTTRFDFKGGTLFLSRPGLYRFDLRSGQLHVETHEGLAELPAGVGSVLLRTSQEAVIDGSSDVRKASLTTAADDFWSWVDERRHPEATARTAEVVGSDTAGHAAVLDSYGTWVHVDATASWAWRPYVQAGWTPYGHGRWYWTPVGWNWISYEPWGWYPYHYGSWYLDASYGWLWCWDWVWGPAWVHWIYTPGYIGWCPRGYYDWRYDNREHRGGHEWNGPGEHGPGRWGNAYDFSGRVRLRDVDPRPWNMVPSDQFTNSRLDRVRVDPGRILRDADSDARGVVRSGPLVTRPSRGDIERTLAGDFRNTPGGRTVPALDRILGRDDNAALTPADSSALRPVRTRELASVGSRPRTGSSSGDTETAPVSRRTWTDRSGGPIVDVSGAPGRRSPAAGRSGDSTPTGGADSAAPGRTEPTRGSAPGTDSPRTPRTSPDRAPSSAPAREPSTPRSRELQPAPARPAPAPAQAPPSRRLGYTDRIRSFEGRMTDSGAAGSGATGEGGSRAETWVVSTPRGERTVRIYTPYGSARSSSEGPRQLVPGSSVAAPGRYETGRPGVRELTRSAPSAAYPGAASGAAPRFFGGAATPRSYQPSPSGGSSPRASAPAGQSAAPRSVPSSGGGSYRAAPSPSHVGSTGSRPHGRR